jgi:hypothetical protein
MASDEPQPETIFRNVSFAIEAHGDELELIQCDGRGETFVYIDCSQARPVAAALLRYAEARGK